MAGTSHKKSSPSEGHVLTQALFGVQRALGLSQKDLSEIIHTSESTISRYKNGSDIDVHSAEAQFALYLIRIYRSLDTLVGGDDIQSTLWLKNQNDYFGEKPLSLLKTMAGIHKVLNYLDAMRGLA